MPPIAFLCNDLPEALQYCTYPPLEKEEEQHPVAAIVIREVEAYLNQDNFLRMALI